MSKGEDKVESLLKANGVLYQKEVKFKGLKSLKHRDLRFDFVVFNRNRQIVACIEVDGEQHFKPTKYFKRTGSKFKQAQERDRIKNNFCLMNHIPLIRIPYYDLNSLTFQKIFSTPEYIVKSIYHNDILSRR